MKPKPMTRRSGSDTHGLHRALFRSLNISISLSGSRRSPRCGSSGTWFQGDDPQYRSSGSVAGVPIVASLGPIIGGAAVGEPDRPDLLETLDAVLDWDHQP